MPRHIKRLLKNFSTSTYNSANYLASSHHGKSNIFGKLNHTARVENTNVTELLMATDALQIWGQQVVTTTSKLIIVTFLLQGRLSAHNCKNAGEQYPRGFFLQAGGSYGTCCYSANAAQSELWRGGFLTGNPGNTCKAAWVDNLYGRSRWLYIPIPYMCMVQWVYINT